MSSKSSWQVYQDFIIKIEHAGEGTYSVMAQGPTGEAETTFELPWDEKDLKIFLLEVGRPRRLIGRGRVPEPMRQVVDFGDQLYNAMMRGDVRDIFVSARRDARHGDHGLRIKLRLSGAPKLVNLPWEFLYDGRDFLALSSDTPVVRYLDLPTPPRPMIAELPLKMLVTISTPHDLIPLDVEAERFKLRDALASLEFGRMLEIDFMTDATLGALQRKLRQAKLKKRPYHVWHYIGHGVFDTTKQSSVLMFCDGDGRSCSVDGFQLGTLFNSYPEMRLMLLNACEGARTDVEDPFSGVATALVERGVSAVIGMQFEVSDQAAIAFAEEFYTALVEGLPVDAALTEARRAVFFLPNWIEWATPVLFMRIKNGQLFQVRLEGRVPEAIGLERGIGQRKQTTQPVFVTKVGQKLRVLISGSDSDLVELLRLLLDHQGFETATALDSLSVFLKATETTPDVVVVDSSLGNVEGVRELTVQLRTHCPKAKILLLTSGLGWTKRPESLNVVVDSVLLKPFYPEELIESLTKVLQTSEM